MSNSLTSEFSPKEAAAPYRSEISWRVTIHSYLIPLRRYWWILIPFIAASVGRTYYQYKNEATVYVSNAMLKISPRLSLLGSDIYREEFANFYGTQLLLMKSPEVRNKARERLQDTDPEVAKPSNSARIEASLQHNTSVFNLRATGNDPKYTQLFLDAVIQEYLNFRRQERDDTTELTLSKVNAEITRLGNAIEQAEQDLKDWSSQNNIVFVREQANSSAQQLVNLNHQLANLEKEHNLIVLYEEQRQKARSGQSDDILLEIDDLMTDNSSYMYEKQKIHLLEAERSRFKEVLRPEHPKMKRFGALIAQSRNKLEVFRLQSERSFGSRVKAIRTQIANLQDLRDKWKERAVKLSSSLAEYERLISKRDRSKVLYDQQLENMQKIDHSRHMEQELVSVFRSADHAVPHEPDLHGKLPGAIAIGAGLGLLTIFVITRWTEVIYTEKQMPLETGFQIAGYIPKQPRRKRLALIKPDDKRYSFIESFRSLRSFVLQSFKKPIDGHLPKKILSITSAVPSEGKSTVSSNLAVSMALAGQRVLLIDADMRRGNQHDAFGANNSPGLSDVLAGNISWQEALFQTDYDNLTLLPRGEVVMSSSELILSPLCKGFFDEIEQAFDFILVDTPPVLATDDMANLIEHVHEVLLVARLSLSTRKSVEKAVEMLDTRNANILGFVLNSCDSTSSYYYYKYRYYGYYHSDPKKKKKK